MNVVFADTFYFLGLTNRADDSHSKCVAFSRDFRGTIVTTAWVLVEVADALASPAKRIQAANLIQNLYRNPLLKIVEPSQSLLMRGLELYSKRHDKDWSLTDCISFTAMNDLGLKKSLTGDHHFEQAGFEALLK